MFTYKVSVYVNEATWNKSYVWTAVWNGYEKWSSQVTMKLLQLMPEKISLLNGIRAHNFCHSNHWAMKPFMVVGSIVSSNHWAVKPFIVVGSIVSSNHWAMKLFMVGRSIVSSNQWAMKPFMVGRSISSSNKPALILSVWMKVYEIDSCMNCDMEWIWQTIFAVILQLKLLQIFS